MWQTRGPLSNDGYLLPVFRRVLVHMFVHIPFPPAYTAICPTCLSDQERLYVNVQYWDG